MRKFNYPFVIRARARGKEYSYYRRTIAGDTRRFRIDGKFGSPEWLENYQRIHAQHEQEEYQVKAGTIADIVRIYRASPSYKSLPPKTRRDYGRYLGEWESKFGPLPVKKISRKFIIGLRDAIGAEKPRKANFMLQIGSILAEAAIDQEIIASNPFKGVRKLKQGKGHRPLEDEEIERFRAYWPLHTKERLAFELLLNTGQRSGDIRLMQRKHVSRETITITQSKTGARMAIPIFKALREALSAHPGNDLEAYLIQSDRLTCYSADFFSRWMAKSMRDAGIEGETAHGLRHTAATILYENGIDPTLITGHATAAMAKHYTSQARGLKAAQKKLEGE